MKPFPVGNGFMRGDALDWDYISQQTGLLGIADFERKRRELALKVFFSANLPALSDEEEKMLLLYLNEGVYGNIDNHVRNRLRSQSKAAYILRQIFPDIDYIRESVPFVDRHPALYPAGIVYRWWRSIAFRRKRLRRIVEAVRKYDK